jgi:hypothetical protein
VKKKNLQEKLIRDYVRWVLLDEAPIVYKEPKSDQEKTALLKLFDWAVGRAKSRPGFFGPSDFAEAAEARKLAVEGEWMSLLQILRIILNTMKVQGIVPGEASFT